MDTKICTKKGDSPFLDLLRQPWQEIWSGVGACELDGGKVHSIHFKESIRSYVLSNFVFNQHHGTRRIVKTKHLRGGRNVMVHCVDARLLSAYLE
jgi:hypothetical protein